MKVVCIDDSWSKYPGRYSLPNGPLREGEEYTVVRILKHLAFNNVLSYQLDEKRVIDEETGGETGFLVSRFVSREYYTNEFHEIASCTNLK